MSQHAHLGSAATDNPAHEASTLQHLLGGALVVGILADLLIWDRQPGVSGFALWVLCFTGVYFWLQVRQRRRWPGAHRLVWIAVPPLAAGLLVLRAHEAFVFLMLMLMTLATTMAAAMERTVHWQNLRLPVLLLSFVQSALKLVIGLPLVLQALRSTGAARQGTQTATGSQASAWLRGLILALPLLAIFIALFYVADAGFRHLLDSAGNFIGEEAGNHLLRSGIFTWLGAGLLYALLVPGMDRTTAATTPPDRASSLAGSLGQEETTVILGSLCLLFISFTLLQLGYLFGGSATIEMTPGLTVAGYARRGFFELLIVSVLTLLVLMGLGFLSREQRRFRVLATVLLVCVFIMQLSAVQRLVLYVDYFGLTLARWMAAWLLLWIAGVLAWFGVTLWRQQTHGFVYGSATWAALLLLLCVASNPVARVADLNLQRHIDDGLQLDTNYLRLLGTDAVPLILSRFDQLQAMPRCELALQLLSAAEIWEIQKQDGWRHFSLSRWQALRVLEEWRSELERMRASPLDCLGLR